MLKNKKIIISALAIVILASIGGAFALHRDTPSKTVVATPVKSEDRSSPDFSHAKLYKAGDTVQFATQTMKLNSVRTTTSLSTQYSSPQFADAGTKFVVVNLTITNTTNNPFMYNPFILFDQKDRQYDVYKDSVWTLDNYFTGQTLSPSVPMTAEEAYQVPQDSTSFRLGGYYGNSNQLQLIQFSTN